MQSSPAPLLEFPVDDTSQSLLDRLRSSPDDASWRRLVDLYTPFLHRVVRAQGVGDGEADDLVQEVFSVVIREMAEFQHSGRKGAFRNWLRGVLVNRLRRHWEARRKAPADGNPAALDDVQYPNSDLERMWDEEHNRWITMRLMEVIEPEFKVSTWQAFRRQVVDEATPRTVAAELGVSLNAVLIAKSRVLRRMRRELDGLTD
jgi:RNA polymerase sigma factor (sigma-70 family)